MTSNEQVDMQRYVNSDYPCSALTARIIAAAQVVHRELGPGFRELFYQRALALELDAQQLDYGREVWIDVHYRGRIIGHTRVDFVIETVLLETKARATLVDVDMIQTLSYLRASGYQIGLLINFGAPKLEIRRLIN